MGYSVLRPENQVFAVPSWRPDEPERRVVEPQLHATLQHSQANLWRYPPGARGRRHREPVQEEVFCVVEGMLTMLLGDPPKRFVLPASSLVVVEPRTPLQLRNESNADVLVRTLLRTRIPELRSSRVDWIAFRLSDRRRVSGRPARRDD